MNSDKKERRLGMYGTIIGLIALGVAILHFTLGPIEEPEPVESFVADTAVKLKEAIKAKVQGKEYSPPIIESSPDADEMLYISIMVAGFIAIALGVFGFIQKEEWRPSGMALALGASAIAFQVAIAIVGAILAFIIIAALISSMGGDLGI